MTRYPWIIVLIVRVLVAPAAHADPLRPPFDIAAIGAAKGGTVEDLPCAMPPAPVRDMIGTSFYADKERSRADPKRLAINETQAKPVRDFLAGIERSAERWVRSRAALPAAAACALTWLDAWAKASAMLGQTNRQGSYERKWTAGGLALAWLEIRDAPGLDAAAISRVLGWFRRIAVELQPPYDRAFRPGLSSVSNNHAYWAGLAIAAAGIALDDRGLFDWGLQRLRIGIDQVNADGALPLELARGRLALHYHLFAIKPLLVLNEMAHANGIDLESDGKLARLVATVFAGVENSALFARLAGVAQSGSGKEEDRDPMVGGAGFEVWLRRHPVPAMAAAVTPHRPFRVPWLGGNVSLLYGP